MNFQGATSTLAAALFLAATLGTSPAAMAGSEKDCLLKGTVERSGASSGTQVKIHSISKYDEESRCRVRRGQKLEFKLPQDNRLESAPTGSEVEYRYRSDDRGESNAELIRVEA